MMTLYPDYDFDLAIWGWKWDPDVEESLRSYTCAQAPDGWNDCGLCDPQYDELYARQSDPMLSDEERQDVIWQMQEIFYESRCYIVLTYPPSVSAYRTERFAHWNTTDYSTLWFPKGLLQLQPVR